MTVIPKSNGVEFHHGGNIFVALFRNDGSVLLMQREGTLRIKPEAMNSITLLAAETGDSDA